jgi:pilus assembly protein CpaE
MSANRSERGQASVELVAVLPFVVLLAALVLQLAIVGYGLWTSANAARAGARAAHVGGDPREAARSAVPRQFRRGFEARGDPLDVSFRVPSLIPGVESIPVGAAADLGVGEGRG